MKALASASADGSTAFDGNKTYKLVFCRDCRHSVSFQGRLAAAICYAQGEPRATTAYDLVTGERASIFDAEATNTCVTMRSQGGKCGPEGKLFEAPVRVG